MSWRNGSGALVKVDLKSVYKVVARGKTYYYAWKGKGAPRLHAPPGTDEFVTELEAALSTRRKTDGRRISDLIVSYKCSRDWDRLAPRTKIEWDRWLGRINDRFGILSIKQFDRAAIRPEITDWRDEWAQTPRAADMGIQVLSRLMTFAAGKGLILVNPCKGISQIYEVDRSEIIWTASDFERLKAVSSPEIYQAARLGALTGLRLSDLLKLSWSHVAPLAIEIRTGKSRGKRAALIPLHGELRELLAAIPKRATTVLTNTDGMPWRSGFTSSWQKAMKRAGLKLHFHDLRGTAATRLYVGGITIREIAEILAWSEDQVERLIDRYVKRDEILLDRIRRLDANAARTPPEKQSEKPPGDK